MKRLQIGSARRARITLAVSACMLSIAGCGGGGGDGGAPAAGTAGNAVVAPAAGGTGDAGARGTAPLPASQPAPASPSTPAPAPAVVVAKPVPYSYYKLGAPTQVGNASLTDGRLGLDGRDYPDANLTPGSCSVGGGIFTQCASVSRQPVYTLCSPDAGNAGSNGRIRSRYVLFDPGAERVTDAQALKNLSFDGFENCGQDNVGSQPKGAPSATLSFDGNGNLTLTNFDQDPARSTRIPLFFLNLNGDNVSNGVSARFNVYRSNGRYLIVATGVPTSGVTANEPGTLIAFVQK